MRLTAIHVKLIWPILEAWLFFLQEGMLSYEEAIVARQNLIKENQSKVAEIKEQVSKNVEEKNMKHGQPRMTTSS